DGEPLVDRLEGTAVSIDPGEHSFTFETVGEPTVTRQLVIRVAEKERRERVVFGVTPAKERRERVSGVAPAKEEISAAFGLGTQRALAIAAVGVGVVGIGFGTVFGLQAMSKHNDAMQACPDQCADTNGVQLWNDARQAGTLSTISFVVGAAGLGVG